jgi:hypothetical protein
MLLVLLSLGLGLELFEPGAPELLEQRRQLDESFGAGAIQGGFHGA